MIMGAGPEQHGITSNSWEKNNLFYRYWCKAGFPFPTIFNLLNAKLKMQKWRLPLGRFGRLFERMLIDYDISPNRG
jgi:hypothetical protein